MLLSTPTLSLCLLVTLCFAAVKGQDDATEASPSSRILNGVTALFAPTYMVSIQQIVGSQTARHICGGVIIHIQFILTIGTCLNFTDFSQFRVLAGVSDLSSTLGSSHSIVNQIVVGGLSRGNNLAVLLIEPAFTLTPRISVAEISANIATETGDFVHLYGWGSVDPAATMSTRVIKQLTTKVISNSHCQRFYTNMSPNALCTFMSLATGICLGDGGGPAVLAGTNQLVGIISYGVSHCGNGYPDVSTSVSANAHFITNAMNSMLTKCAS